MTTVFVNIVACVVNERHNLKLFDALTFELGTYVIFQAYGE